MTVSKYKLKMGEEPYFAGREDDNAGLRLARYLRLQKKYAMEARR
jgi:hypothetical protein